VTEGTERPILVSAVYENFPLARSVAHHIVLLPRITKAPKTSHPNRPTETTPSPSASKAAAADKFSKACCGKTIKLADEVSAWIAARDAAWRRASASNLTRPDGW
jgi:hypothetical protein